jgi:hypothetical protein
VAVTARAGSIVAAAVNFVLGLAFVHSGAAAWMWHRLESDVSWRTGPTALGSLAYFAIYWGGWIMIASLRHPEVLRRIWRRSTDDADPSEYLRMTDVAAHAVRALVASCVVLAIQVLVPAFWLSVALATLLFAMVVNAYIIRESFARTLTAFAWSGAGVALATLLIHPWFVGQPLFVVRLAVVMTLWDFVGERLGISPRLARFVPSLYSGSGCTADQARVAR